eukprot:scaffold351_cov148-Amphora_coffeaeformis.AAC.13
MAKTKKAADIEVKLSKKDQKKVDKLQAQIPFHESRGNKDEVAKIQQQIDDLWSKAKEAAYSM